MQKIIVIVGPTAVGKTKLSIETAKRFNGEIISGDSMQVYKGMDIGTAKITAEEMEGIPHHLLDIKEPHEAFSVAEFQKLVREKITEITNRHAIPIIVGGTGLYVQSVLYDYQFSDSESDHPPIDIYDKNPLELHKKLESIDPESAKKIHPNNVRRVIRALEIFEQTGKTMTQLQSEQKKSILYNTALIGLTMEREKLYERINKRVDIMIEEGLLNEVQHFYKNGISRESQSVKAIGYKEIYDYLDGKVSWEEAIIELKKNSRNYAKRQFTWFRNKMDVTWFDMTEEREHLKKTSEIIDFIAGKLQIKSNT
ncbi:tRNA (adenosine(37)-N6)-dimethylallyltransferase MiaA [Lederbergia wuyishanensis]|uniref:tRNA dimethylallyltransferase n=1 Tax=Lederbergia wuyishanensis TaxID=1347903 RepID=A0ABU0CZZ1_9BACI|nr:tRNA (adenosine(37)-N6)-dimethylallyltransferase MiaA [Lederbergia wuyishanensis]MCJ8006356.1 tRNA (adenosine(37)-N6)-dimethylallyltransferase MiaA [Lederbergia wuyishanensis]MDQ0341725.1 tRNA dimethylallyltransferase [Lederbergia wuyishanensis]